MKIAKYWYPHNGKDGKGMTLHVSVLTPYYALHIGDRHISLTDARGRMSPFSRDSNKTLTVSASNGELLISFAGLAFIGGLPTDIWLLSKISGIPVSEMKPDGVASAMHLRRIDLNIGSVLGRLDAALMEGVRNDSRVAKDQQVLEVLVSGWTWPRRERAGKRAKTIHKSLTYRGSSGGQIIRGVGVPLTAGSGNQGLVDTIGNVGGDLRDELAQILTFFDSKATGDQRYLIIRTVVRAIRERSGDASGIGGDLISTFLPFNSLDANIDYWPLPSTDLTRLYSPVILDQEGINFSSYRMQSNEGHASLHIGSKFPRTIHFGAPDIRYESPAQEPPSTFYFSAQEWKKFPNS